MEVILQIVEYLSPANGVNFASTCKQIREIEATEPVRQHRQLQKAYTDLRFSGCHFHETSIKEHPMMLLKAIVANPSIQYYPRSLTIKTCLRNLEVPMCDTDEDGEIVKTMLARDVEKECWAGVIAMMSPVGLKCFGN